MNSLDHQLEHLLRAAAKAGAVHKNELAEPPPPFGMETRVLAAWRKSTTQGADGLGWLPLGFLCRATACACAVMLATVLFNVQQISSSLQTESQTYGELAMVDSVIQQSLEP